MEKEDIIKKMVCVWNDMGVCLDKKVKRDKWKGDIVVDQEKQKVGFNVWKNGGNIEERYRRMGKEGVCGCWVVV